VPEPYDGAALTPDELPLDAADEDDEDAEAQAGLDFSGADGDEQPDDGTGNAGR
jgi:segregation and condensation protein B